MAQSSGFQTSSSANPSYGNRGKFVNEYKKVAVNSASPLQLVIMLYDGALQFIEVARVAIPAQDYEKQNSSLQRAQKIVMELMSCLDMERGGDVSSNLFSLYGYVLNQLVDANLHDSSDALERGRKVLAELRESWVQLEQMQRTKGLEEPARAAA